MSFHEITLPDPKQSRELAKKTGFEAEIMAAMIRPEDSKAVESMSCPECERVGLNLESKGVRDTPARVILHTKCPACGADIDIIV